MKNSLITILLVLFLAVSACAQGRISDREWDWLKGRVQKVVTEKAMFTNESGKQIEARRELNDIVTYNTEGDRVREENYSKGKLTKINDYSLIDGERVVKEETVSVPFNGGGVGVAKKDNVKPSDTRYTYKLKREHDKGKRTEEAWYRNDGSLWRRYVRAYDEKNNKVELFIYTAEGKTVFHSVVTLDDKGNATEETWLVRGGLNYPKKWSYSYEFDSTGNWIKKKRLELITKDGKSYFEPYDIYYRTITYF